MNTPKVLIEYKNEDLQMDGLYSLNQIAKANKIVYQSLKRQYEKNYNIHEAIKIAKEKQEIRKGQVVWQEEQISLVKLAEKLQISNTTLSRYYKKTKNIEEAVQMTKQASEARFFNVQLEDGTKTNIEALARENDLVDHILMRIYKQTGNIEEALEQAKRNQEAFHGTIFYEKDGQKHTANYIARENKIHPDVFKKFYRKTNNVEKAILLAKEGQRRKEKNRGKSTWMQYFDLKQTSRKTPIIQEQAKARTIQMIEGESLFSYCRKHGYNYDSIEYLIHEKSMTVQDAISSYEKNGQTVPKEWIYEKYGVLFRHLMLSFQLRSDDIVRIMKRENCSIRKAMEEYIWSMDNDGFSKNEVSLLHEISSLLKTCNEEESKEVIQEFYLEEREIALLEKKNKKINDIDRKILLYDFSTVLHSWEKEDLIDMMLEYEITDKEVVEIYTNLYTPFKDKILLPSESMEKKRRTKVEDFIASTYQEQEEVWMDKLKQSDFSKEEKLRIVDTTEKIRETIQQLNEKRIQKGKR